MAMDIIDIIPKVLFGVGVIGWIFVMRNYLRGEFKDNASSIVNRNTEAESSSTPEPKPPSGDRPHQGKLIQFPRQKQGS